jgi:hypothetical protein
MAYEDLLKDTSVADPSNNYFTLTITDLNPNTNYPIQLRWKYKDGTFSNWSAVKRLLAKAVTPAAPALPSVPTLKRVVGAIEISWDGKTSNGADQPPTSFVDAEIYISTVSGFIPTKGGSTNNYIDILDFANGQNTLNIGVGTVVNPTFTIDYGIDYYVKIRSRNSDNVYSAPVTANGSPIKVGQLSDAGLIEVKADKITTGTLQSNSTITVGATTGKHVVIRGTGNPLSIYGSGGSTTTPILDFDETGNLSIKGTITATGGIFEGSMSASNMRIGTKVNYINIANQNVSNPAHWYGGLPLDGIFIGTNNYWYNDGVFKVGDGTNYLNYNGSSILLRVGSNSNFLSYDGTKLQLTGDIKLLSSTTADNIQILTSEPNVIKFESPQSLFNVAGFISNVTTSNATTMKLSPSSRASWANNPFISIENGGLASDPSGTSIIKLESFSMQIKSQSTVNIVSRGSSTAVDGSSGSTSVRNIWFNNVAPTSGQGLVGDVWMQYA